MDIDNIPIFIIKVNSKGDILYLNKMIKEDVKFNGLSKITNINEIILNLLPTNIYEEDINNYETTIYIEKTNRIEVNISSRRINADEINIFLEGAYKYYNVKHTFMSNFGHEVRNPLNSVIGIISLLQDTHLDKEQLNYLDMLKESSGNLMNIVDNILEYTKLEAGKLKLNLSSFSLRDCIEAVHTIMGNNATTRSIKMSYTINDNTPEFIICDCLRLQQILINLYSNSLKFTQVKGTIHTGISSVLDKEGNYKIIVNIKDSGSIDHIIKKEDYTSIFRSYNQLFSDFNDRNNEGTGLGLAISKELVLLMGGDIWVESSTHEDGTNFIFYIQVEKSYEEGTPIDYKLLNKKKALVVDDIAINRVTLCNTLRKSGMIPYPVSTSEEALILLKNDMEFDIALLDMYLPRFTGPRLAEHIRIIKPKLPLIALSSIGDKINFTGTNLFNHLLVKPVKENKLLSIIQSVLINTEQPLYKEIKEETSEKIKFLLNDDDTFNRQVLRKQIEKLGYNYIIEVNNGQECIDILNIKEFDIIFIDMKTPIKNGYDVIEHIKENEIKGYTICLSGLEIKNPEKFHNILLKPVEILRLKEIINDYKKYVV